LSKKNNPAVNRHFKLQIKTLQNGLIDADKLDRLLKAKEERERQRACDLLALLCLP
jgi:hypothetical protein